MSSPGAPNGLTFHVLARAAALLILWLVLAGSYPADLPVGLVAVFAATLTSLRLFPPDRPSVSAVALVRLVLRFLCQSVVAGADVAWRAPSIRDCRCAPASCSIRFAGSARNTFAALGACYPAQYRTVAAQLAAEEAALTRAIDDD